MIIKHLIGAWLPNLGKGRSKSHGKRVAKLTPGQAGALPFDPAPRDLRMNRAVARFTSRHTPYWAGLATLVGERSFARAARAHPSCTPFARAWAGSLPLD